MQLLSTAAYALLAGRAGALAGAGRSFADVGHFHCEPSSAPDGIWKPKKNESNDRTRGKRNICIQGKQVPDLYLLGAPKCATTSLAYELISAGSICAGGIKEYHFFTKSRVSHFEKDEERVTAQWLSGMPRCSDTRKLMGDYSPENLQLTRPPGHPFESELPPVLAQLYGASARKLNFVVMVREHLSRIHSFFHYRTNREPGEFGEKVEKYLAEYTAEAISSGYNGVWASSYGFQLSRWVQVFDHKQFYVIPFKAFGQGNASRICHDLSHRFHYRMRCGHTLTPVQKNRGSHPDLEDEISVPLRWAFEELMRDDRMRLVYHLTLGSKRGMGLALYDGPEGNHKAVNEWLRNWW